MLKIKEKKIKENFFLSVPLGVGASSLFGTATFFSGGAFLGTSGTLKNVKYKITEFWISKIY